MKIIKRNGSEVEFDVNKIITAITKANNSVKKESDRIGSDKNIRSIADNVVYKIEQSDQIPNVELVQDLVEHEIVLAGYYEVAKSYIIYRHERSLARASNTTDDRILSLINLTNEEAKQENSNKNPVVNSTQRDYMAGEVSKDLSNRILLPKHITDAHNEGIIHFHDTDYFAQHMHNCFSGKVEFLTPDGPRAFNEFSNGEKVIVYDKDGVEREATVHCYGVQSLQNVYLVAHNKRDKIRIRCTSNHRWVLADGSVTMDLKVGDKLYAGHTKIYWTVEYISSSSQLEPDDSPFERVFCVEEPVTKTFTLAGPNGTGIVTGNCDLVNLEDMLQNGTVISGTMIEKPHSFATACNIATQIAAQVASNQYGGQTMTLTHLAPFVDISRKKIRSNVIEENAISGIEMSEEAIHLITEKRLREEIKKGVQTIQYQIVTLLTTNGQAPFITIFMYLNEARNEDEKKDLAIIIEEMLLQRIQGVKNEQGVWVTPAFPKLIYVEEEDNIHEDSKYWYLTKLAAQCTAKRMVPDYISEKKMLELKIDKNGNGNCYPCMGCRSFLTPYVDPETNKPKYYGRFNMGVVTLNLPDIALSSGGDVKKFWDIFDERLELCYEALQCRIKRLKGTPSDVAPILWQHGAIARLKKGENIDKLFYGGYATISLGYAGLYECVKYMTGKSHTDSEATPFALEIMEYMNAACRKWKKENNIDFSIYGTPLESTTYKFAKCLQKRFGIIKGITDRGYISNSYHRKRNVA